ncbi:MAG: exodeoxyribonuclease VII small subunit [Rhodoferax sp.]|nr:exodeoxyribonuclease VII small subunit [Rhodoferax sp.]
MPKASATPPSASALSTTPEDAAALPSSYEEAMQELEALVRRLESGEMPLEQLLSGYQRGAALLQLCREKLQAVEDQIKVLDDGALKNWKAS